jgi:signal transduction histidine kinase
MDRLAAAAFPFPNIADDGIRRDGSLIKTPTACVACSRRECEQARPDILITVCHKGLSYRRVTESVLVFGLAVSDTPTCTKASKQAVRNAGKDSVRTVEVTRACDALTKGLQLERQTVAAKRDQLLDEFRDSDDYIGQLAGHLAPEIMKALGQFHDYRAVAGRALRNIGLYIGRDQSQSFDEQLEAAPKELTAAYWATSLMIDKLDTALFLLSPEAITDVVDPAFRFHGLALKYTRIYQSEMDAKKLEHFFSGESRAVIANTNSRAISVFPLTFLDNAVKYAPAGSNVQSYFKDTQGEVIYAVESLGPEIRPDEQRRIFEPFFRGEAAKSAASDGMGIGLGLCRLVADRLGLTLTCLQQPEPVEERYFLTRFEVKMPRRRD